MFYNEHVPNTMKMMKSQLTWDSEIVKKNAVLQRLKGLLSHFGSKNRCFSQSGPGNRKKD